MRYTFALLLWIATYWFASAGLRVDEYTWSDRSMYEISDAEKLYSSVIMKETRMIEFDYPEGDPSELREYYVYHVVVRLNSAEAINNYNKIYLSNYGLVEIKELKARTLNENGIKEIELGQMEEFEGESNESYKYVAIDGLEVGSELEYYYVLEKRPNGTGRREFFQGQEYKKNVSFHLIAPRGATMLTKSYNGFPAMQLDSSDTASYHLSATASVVPGLQPEEFSNYYDNLQRVEYKFERFSDDLKEVGKYSDLAFKLKIYFLSPVSKGEKKAIKGLKKQIGKATDTEQQIRKIEEYIKNNIELVDYNGSDYEVIESVIASGTANRFGTMRLYSALFQLYEIPYSFVVTTNRSQISFDPEFESYTFLDKYLFYFPTIDKYADPEDLFMRVGYISSNFMGNHGMFFTADWNLAEGITEPDIKYIDPLLASDNEDDLFIDIDLGSDFSAVKMKVRREMTGYNAAYIQSLEGLIAAEDLNRIFLELMEPLTGGSKLSSLDAENSGMQHLFFSPFVLNATSDDARNLLQKAGKNYLFKIGETIGQQIEMYQDKKRETAVDLDFNHAYKRVITISIPEGYKIANLDDVNITIKQEGNSEPDFGFETQIQESGNQVTISIIEYYKALKFPIEEFENFRQVINAAADFNKKVLVFEPL